MWFPIIFIVLVLGGWLAYWLYNRNKENKENELVSQEIERLLSYDVIPVPDRIGGGTQGRAYEELLGFMGAMPLSTLPPHIEKKVRKLRYEFSMRGVEDKLQEEIDYYLPYLEYMPTVTTKLVNAPIWNETEKKAEEMYYQDGIIFIKKDYYTSPKVALDHRSFDLNYRLILQLSYAWALRKGADKEQLTEKVKELVVKMVQRHPQFQRDFGISSTPVQQANPAIRQPAQQAVQLTQPAQQPIQLAKKDDPLGILDEDN
jgi:hypothetical protein